MIFIGISDLFLIHSIHLKELCFEKNPTIFLPSVVELEKNASDAFNVYFNA